MKLILIDGGPASGKNTLGKILVDRLNEMEEKSILLDKDTYVEEFCPTWIWLNDEQKEKDLLNAKDNFLDDINKYLKDGLTVVAIGERLLTEEDIRSYTIKLNINVPIHLFHLSIPLKTRRQRLQQRGPHSLIDIDKDQKDRDEIKSWPGYVYNNINSPEIDVINILNLIKNNEGLIDR